MELWKKAALFTYAFHFGFCCAVDLLCTVKRNGTRMVHSISLESLASGFPSTGCDSSWSNETTVLATSSDKHATLMTNSFHTLETYECHGYILWMAQCWSAEGLMDYTANCTTTCDVMKLRQGDEDNPGDMDNESSANTIVSCQNPPSTNHLKPLSVYSRRVMCDQQKGPRSPVEPPDPFVNFKIKIVNDSGRKRKLGHSGTINDYNSPLKKQCSSNALSPDLGCFMDYSSSLTRNNSLSPFAAPYPVLKEETAARSVTKETVSSRLDLEHVQCGCSKEEVEKTERIVKNMSSVFDNDINEILCLNPPKLELVKPNIKEEKPDAGPVEDDRGYLSSVLHSEECKTEDPPEQLGHEQASTGAPHFSFLIKDSSETLTGPLLGPVKCDGSFLEGEDEVFNIGQPIFESSICQPSAEAEQKSGLSEALRTVNVSQTYNSGDYTVDTLYETTLPLQVQVKSKVVVPGQSEGISKPATSTQSEQKTSSADKKRDKAVKRGRGHRPKILDNSMEWEHHKRQYIFSVKSHMTENPGRAQGPMTELLDLMTHVAGQTGSNGSQWQHPSDLTCRNYQKRFGNETPTMTLSEWQAQNNTHHRRFSKVSKIFERSPYP